MIILLLCCSQQNKSHFMRLHLLYQQSTKGWWLATMNLLGFPLSPRGSLHKSFRWGTFISLRCSIEQTRNLTTNMCVLFQNETPGPGSYDCIAATELISPSFSKKGTTGFVPSKVSWVLRWFKFINVSRPLSKHQLSIHIACKCCSVDVSLYITVV